MVRQDFGEAMQSAGRRELGQKPTVRDLSAAGPARVHAAGWAVGNCGLRLAEPRCSVKNTYGMGAAPALSPQPHLSERTH
jgi:hypothetical protein